jgi:molecular chaperone Hsp33
VSNEIEPGVEAAGRDHLIRAIAWGGRVRVVACDTSGIVEDLRRIHDPSPVVTAAIGRLATGALLLASTLEKVTGREPVLTVEIDGGGPAGRMLATASPAGWVRATVANPLATARSPVQGKLNVAGVVGTHGELSVTRDLGSGDPFRGVVPINTGEIARDFAHYLHDSEQVPSAVLLGVHVHPHAGVDHAGGLLVQLLPGVSDLQAELLTSRIEELGTVTSRLLAGDGPSVWLAELFPEGSWILERRAVMFRCGCSMERVETALKLLGADEIRAIADDCVDEPAVLGCGFCRTDYRVERATLETLLRELEQEAADPATH